MAPCLPPALPGDALCRFRRPASRGAGQATCAARPCAAYLSRAARGSWLIVSTGHYEDKELADRLQRAATHARFFNHDAAAAASWLTGLEVVPPGVCGANQWVAGTGGVPSGRPAYPLVAAAVKTSD